MRRSGRRLRLHVGYLQRIVKLCLKTAQRIGEVAGMVPAELDLKAREWRLPGSRIKNANAHVVPLSDLALEIIKEAAADAGKGAPIFPYGNGSVSPVAIGNAIRRSRRVLTTRSITGQRIGLRGTFALG
ncbi:MAG: tyrosine-type recombinase/integrase [Pseudolabrys sp.]